jgi:hypothetical protein
LDSISWEAACWHSMPLSNKISNVIAFIIAMGYFSFKMLPRSHMC